MKVHSSPELEQIVLGAILLDKACIIEAQDLLTAEAFYTSENQIIFISILEISNQGKEVDLITLLEQLKKTAQLEKIGGALAVSELTNRVASTANFTEHCLILKQHQMQRMQVATAHNILRMAEEGKNDAFEINEYIADQVHQIENISTLKQEHDNTELCRQMIQQMEKAAAMEGITGVPTGFTQQDRLFTGWQAPDLIIMAARPGMGKTAKALCDIFNMAVLHDKTVMIFSLEMSALQMFKRLASLATQIDADKLKRGNLSEAEWGQFHSYIESILTDKIIIVDDCYTVQEVRSRVKRERMDRGIDCVYLDYLQLMEGQGNNREQEISHISRSLKKLCREVNIPLIALSQLSRKVEERGDKRPMLKDLRESGAIEQDADIVTFLYRPQYYDPEDSPGLAYLLVAKHRNGALMDIELKYNHNRAQFLNQDNPWGGF